MAITPDLIVLRKLALGRQLYLEATRQKVRPTGTSRLIAIIELDAAIETVVKAGLTSLGKRREGDLPELVDRLTKAATDDLVVTLPHTHAVRRVRTIRNAAQHDGRLPTADELEECHSIGRAYLDGVTEGVWGRSFSSIGLLDLVENDQVRAYLARGQEALGSGDVLGAVERSGEALQWALDRVETSLVGRGDRWTQGIVTEDAFHRQQVSRDLTQAIRRTQETVLYLALGLDLGDLLRFRAVAGNVVFTFGGAAHHSGIADELTLEHAEFALGYASEAVVQIEAAVGAIDRPFGREHWW